MLYDDLQGWDGRVERRLKTESVCIYINIYIYNIYIYNTCIYSGLPWWLSSKESACSAGSPGGMSSVPGLGRSPGEESMATHSSILAWRIPWTEEPGGLQSIGSQRVGLDSEEVLDFEKCKRNNNVVWRQGQWGKSLYLTLSFSVSSKPL